MSNVATTPIQDVPAGLTVGEISKKLGISYYQALRWACLTKYEVNKKRRGRGRSALPKITIPPGLLLEEIQERLGVSYHLARRWCRETQYVFKDGRYRSGRSRRATEEQVKAMVAFLTKYSHLTLHQVGIKLGISRERVRQLYKLHNLTRQNHRFVGEPHTRNAFPKEVFLPMLAEDLTGKQMAHRLRTTHSTVSYLLHIYGLKIGHHSPNTELLKQGKKQCADCKTIKLVSAFSRSGKSKRTGEPKYYRLCKDCHSTSNKKASALRMLDAQQKKSRQASLQPS